MANGYKTGGRQKGVPNRISAELKEMILGALSAAGGVSYLEQQARDNPGPFLALVGKLVPTAVRADVPAMIVTIESPVIRPVVDE